MDEGGRLNRGARGDEFRFRRHDDRGAHQVGGDLPVGGAAGPTSDEEHPLGARPITADEGVGAVEEVADDPFDRGPGQIGR